MAVGGSLTGRNALHTNLRHCANSPTVERRFKPAIEQPENRSDQILDVCWRRGIGYGGHACVGVTYQVSGALKASDGASFRALLGGGSFDGTFVLPNSTFPKTGTTSFSSFTINLRGKSLVGAAVRRRRDMLPQVA